MANPDLTTFPSYYGPRFQLVANGSLASDLIPYISSFEFEDHDGSGGGPKHHPRPHFDSVTFKVANPGLMWLNDPRFAQGARFQVQFGYTGNMSDVKYATISRAKPTFPQAGMPMIDMVAFGLQQDMNKAQNAYNYGPVSSDSIATTIAGRYGFQTDIEQAMDARFQHRVQPAGVSDIQYLQSLAHKLNWDCYIDGFTLHFHHKRFEQAATLVFQYFTDQSGTLMTFSPSVNLTKPPNTVTAGTNAQTGTAAASSPMADDGSVLVSTNQAAITGSLTSTPGGPNYVAGAGGLQSASHEANPSVVALHGAAQAQRINMDTLKASASMIGNPLIKARTMITIQGVGMIHSGNWRVTTSKHVITAKGYVTHVELARDAGMAASSTQNTMSPTGANGQSSGATPVAVSTSRGTFEYSP